MVGMQRIMLVQDVHFRRLVVADESYCPANHARVKDKLEEKVNDGINRDDLKIFRVTYEEIT